ncbi:restriction endonuclease subunit S [Methylomonas sp. EbB]|uniref:Restriction endonuclease subunit S n=1 Tax=Methylomonas fluvii TaxID=1854564 RepID=A0ABR9DB93_9GAMM|nr:restriction endonuclease subunit S [Methylomonas fluvii]
MIGSYCEVIAGQSPEGKYYNADGNGMAFYQGKKDFGDKFIEAPTTWTTKSTKIARKGDILMSVRAPVGPVNFSTEEICIGRGLAAIRRNDQLDAEFLYYQLLHLQREIAGKEGAVFASINKSEIAALPIVIGPLPEQHRIVAILDEAFDGIATAKANAERNLQNARALFESHLQAVFSQRSEGWEARRLGEVFCIGSSKRILEAEWTATGVPFYGGKEIVKLAKFGTVISNAYISEEKYQDYASKYDMPQQGDILITARGTIGVGYVVKEGDKFYYKDGNIISMREKTPTNPHFILYAFRSNAIADQLEELNGATVRHLPIEKAKELVLRMPGFVEQNTVVEKIREIESETQRLESLYQQKLAALDELKKSLLHQAFSGNL